MTHDELLEQMEATQKEYGYDRRAMALMCGVPVAAITIVTEGGVIHPNIAARICGGYGLGKKALKLMIHSDHWDKLPSVMPPTKDTITAARDYIRHEALLVERMKRPVQETPHFKRTRLREDQYYLDGDALEHIRERRKMPRAKLASLARCSNDYLFWCTQYGTIGRKIATRIAEALECNLKDFVTGLGGEDVDATIT